MPEPSLAQQLTCVRREMALRQKVYARRVPLGTMTQAEAEHELKTMEAVYRSLLRLQEQENPQLSLG